MAFLFVCVVKVMSERQASCCINTFNICYPCLQRHHLMPVTQKSSLIHNLQIACSLKWCNVKQLMDRILRCDLLRIPFVLQPSETASRLGNNGVEGREGCGPHVLLERLFKYSDGIRKKNKIDVTYFFLCGTPLRS